MKIKRITALLALIAAASAAVSCGDTAAPAPAPKTETGTTALSEDSFTEEVQEYPYEIKDFGGYVFKVLNQDDKLWDGTTHILDFDSESGEPINDAIYTRNRNAEEKLNFKLEVIKDVIDGNSIRKKMEQSVLSADDAYAEVYLPLNYSGSTSFTGEYTMNLNDIETLHLTESWWNQAFISSATIGDQLLYTSIDNFNLMGIAWSNAVLFNKNMFESYVYDLPYDAVRKCAWTYDMMYSLIKNVVNLNGADNWDATSDGSCTYGFVTEHSGGIISLLSGSGEFLIQRNDKNIPELNIRNQRLIAAYHSLPQAFPPP
ncbi:MAG: hypothetical protein MJ175_03725, partial [Clostridia bacterium]|nr:hypothetical protein [Clostridia bacterium]